MAVQMGDTLATRDAFRRAITADIVGRAQVAAVPYEGEGPLAGVDVISVRRLEQVVLEHLAVALPPPSEHHAEVTAPATITITNICPECDLPVRTSTKATTILIASKEEGSEVKTKLKTKPAPHVCGQMQLDDAAADAEAQAAKVARDQLVAFPGNVTHDDQRIRILQAVAAVGDRFLAEDGGEPGPLPTLEAIAEELELATEDQRAELLDVLYRYTQLPEEPLLDVAEGQDQPATFTLTDAGATIVDLVESGEALEAIDPELGAIADEADVPGFMRDDDAEPGPSPDPDAPTCVGSNHVPGCEHFPEVLKRGRRTPGDA